MEKHTQREKFKALLDACGSHSQAAREIGIDPAHYRYVRRSGKVSRFVAVMMDKVLESANEGKN